MLDLNIKDKIVKVIPLSRKDAISLNICIKDYDFVHNRHPNNFELLNLNYYSVSKDLVITLLINFQNQFLFSDVADHREIPPLSCIF